MLRFARGGIREGRGTDSGFEELMVGVSVGSRSA